MDASIIREVATDLEATQRLTVSVARLVNPRRRRGDIKFRLRENAISIDVWMDEAERDGIDAAKIRTARRAKGRILSARREMIQWTPGTSTRSVTDRIKSARRLIADIEADDG